MREQLRIALVWVIAQRVVVIYYRRFGTTYWSHLQWSSIHSTLRKIPEGRSCNHCGAVRSHTSPSRLLSHQQRAARRLLTDSAGNELTSALRGATFCNGLRGSSAADCCSSPFCCTNSHATADLQKDGDFSHTGTANVDRQKLTALTAPTCRTSYAVGACVRLA
jgi:hypothetical protein